MKYLLALNIILTIGCAASNSTQAPQTLTEQLACHIQASKNLLIIGDSISMGYTAYVQHNLCGYYNVQRVTDSEGNAQNAQGTTFTLANIDRWLAQAGPQDVIVWNNGLWNARDPSLDPQAPGNATDILTYSNELRLIGQRLVATKARIVFFTTTDIPASGSTFISGRDITENAAALQVMDSLNIEHYDLYALAIQNPKLHHTDDPIHFNTQGYSLFGEFVSDMVRSNYQYSN